MAGIKDLPNELLLQVGRWIRSWRDLNHLAATSRRFSQMIGTYVVRHLAQLDLDSAWLAWLINEQNVRGVERALERGINPNKPVDFRLLEKHFRPMVLRETSIAADSLLMYRRAAGGGMIGVPAPCQMDTFWYDENPEAIDASDTGMPRPRTLFGHAREHRSKDFSPLHLAAQRGNTNIIKLLVKHGANLEASYLDSQGGLIMASKKLSIHDGAKGRILGELGVRPQIRYTPLHCAVLCSNTAAARLLLELGASMRSCTPMLDPKETEWLIPDTPLHAAAFMGNLELVEHILSGNYHMGVNKMDTVGVGPLTYATLGHSLQTVGIFLLEKGADPDVLISQDCSAFLDTCWHGRFEDALTLLDHGAKVEYPESATVRPLHLCCTRTIGRCRMVCGSKTPPVRDAQEHLSLRLVKKLLNMGASAEEALYHPGFNGATPISLAVKSGFLDITKELVSHGARLDTPGGSILEVGLTAECDEQSRFDTVSYLLDQSCDVNCVNDSGETPLQVLGTLDPLGLRRFTSAHEEIIGSRLLDLGANTDIRRESPLEDWLARSYLWPSTGISIFQDFCRPGSYSFCKLLVDRGAADILQDNDLVSIFHQLVRKFSMSHDKTEQLDFMDLILEIDRTDCVLKDPETFAFLLAKRQIEIAQHLLKKGYIFHTETKSGDKILRQACMVGAVDIVEFLLDKGVDINGCDSSGSGKDDRSPIELAALYDWEQDGGVTSGEQGLRLITSLLTRGADIREFQTRATLLDQAIRRNQVDIMEMILKGSIECIPAFPNELFRKACCSTERLCDPYVIWTLLNYPDYQDGLLNRVEGPPEDDSHCKVWKTPLEWLVSTYKPLVSCPQEDCNCGDNLLKCIVVLLSQGKLAPDQAYSPPAKQLLNASRETLAMVLRSTITKIDFRVTGTGPGGRGTSTRHCLCFVLYHAGLTSAEISHIPNRSSFMKTVL